MTLPSKGSMLGWCWTFKRVEQKIAACGSSCRAVASHKKAAPSQAPLFLCITFSVVMDIACGEGIYPRWGAKRPLNQTPPCIRQTVCNGFTTATQSNGDKSPRHKSPLTLGIGNQSGVCSARATARNMARLFCSDGHCLWRGDLSPLGREAAPKQNTSVYQTNRMQWFYECCAVERG